MAAPNPGVNWDAVSSFAGVVAAVGILWAALVARSAARSAKGAAGLSARAAADAAAIARSHALITTIPLVVPTVYDKRAFIKNRGHSEALNVEWKIESVPNHDPPIASGTLPRLLQAGSDADLYKKGSDIVQPVRRARAAGGVLVTCTYTARWG